MDEPTTTQLSMKDALAKVRALHTSKLSNQKQAAALLIAVESTINDQNPNATDTPAAYFATLMTFLEQQNGQKNAEETRAAVLYILNIVFSYLPVSILRARFTDIVGIFGSVLENDKDSAPSIRAVVGCIEYLLVAQDTNSWTTQIAKRLFQTLLQLCIDPRPKVRKRAQDAARRLLLSPPPPALRHPSSKMTAEFCLRVLRETTKTDSQSGLHILALVRIIVSSWPEDSIPALCEELLRLPKLNNSFLSVSAFTVFETMFDKTAASLEEGRIEELFVALTELKPHHNDAQLTIPWLEIVNKGYVAYASNNQVRCAEAFPGVFAMVFPGLQSSDKAVIAATANCLARLVSVCITDAMIVEAVGAFAKRSGEKPKKGPKRTPLETMIYACEQGLGYRFKAGWGGVLQILRALYERLDRRSSPLLNNVLSTLAELRMDLQDLEDAEYKVAIDATLAAAVRAMRPDAFLQVLPLNVDRERDANSPGRAYLLPLIKDAHLKNCELAYFCDTLLPLSDALREKAALCSSDGRAIQGKIYETLAQQIWALFPGFCHLPTDLPKSFSFTFAEKIANQLYAEPELRSVVCQGLQLLVDKATLAKNSLEATAEEKEMRDADLKHLSKFATNLLAVFFNVFSQTPATFRGYILDVIKAYLSVASQADITSTFSKVGTLLTQALATPTPSTNDPTAPPPPAHTMLDLSLAMMPYLDITSASTLYQVATNLIVSKSAEEDPSLQKKSYKALRGMADVEILRKGVLEANIEDLQKKLIDGTELTTASAKKDRLLLFVQVVPLLPSSDLSFIPSVLSEAVVSTKEVNERARNVAYELLVAMGKRMAVPGGQIVQSNIPEMANEQAESSGAQLQQTTVPASITEYFTMVVAGLAGSTAHMISATITALSRLLFEFKEMCKPEIINELINTVHLFVMGTNREVVKAALGFVKVTTVSMNTDILETHLPQIVTGILQWSQEHKSHFKAKVRHIFERLIRRVGYEAVERHIPEEHRKLIINIKKRRERAKRKKNAADKEENDSDDEVEDPADGKGKRPVPSFGNAYEDALYGSESELDDDEEDEEMEEPVPQKGKKGANKKKTTENWIKEDGDGPLDFLDRRVVSRVTSTNPSARRLNRPDGTSAFTSSSDGRLVIDDSEAEGEENNEGMDIDQDDESNEAENHYRDSVTSKDGFTRTPQNRIKFNNKRRRDDDPMDIDPKAKGGKKTKNAPPAKQERIGQAYKAKRAQGDVKKANMPDPYAYVPLNPKSLKKRGAPGAKTSIMATQKNRRK